MSDWTVAEFTCALHAKVLRGETPAEVAHTIGQTLNSLMAQGALHRIAVLREDYAAVQRTVFQPELPRAQCRCPAFGGSGAQQHHALCQPGQNTARCGESLAGGD